MAAGVKASLGKLIRTLQSELYFLKEGKDAAYYHFRKLTRKPHEGVSSQMLMSVALRQIAR